MKIGMILTIFTLVQCSGTVFSQITLPPGTVLPAQLSSSLSPSKNRPGDRVSARIMQDVPLPCGRKIPAGAKLVGRVVNVMAGTAMPAETFRFDRLEFAHQSLGVSVSLRALASMMEVEHAQVPPTGPDRGTPWAWRTRNLIGGEVAYGEGGPVAHGTEIVGEAVADGVLIPVRPNTVSGCRGEVARNIQPQALWVFSSDACGVFGIPDLEIMHAGRTPPVGEITVASKGGSWKIRSGSGMLLPITSVDQH
jgi:hypothetical protein